MVSINQGQTQGLPLQKLKVNLINKKQEKISGSG